MTHDFFAFRPISPITEVSDGPLAGKSILIRPDISMTGWLTDAGSKALVGFHAVSDATVAARLKRAGATFVGSARMAELGFGINGDAMAQALCAGLASAGLMNDTLGEARMAACSTGWFGFKPSYGVLSRHGLVGLSPSMESIGVLGSTPAGIAALLAVMAGPDDQDPSMSTDPPPEFGALIMPAGKPVRIGIPREIRERLNPSETKAFSAATDIMTIAGFEIVDVSLPGFDLFAFTHQVIAAVEASSAAGKYDGVRYGFRAESSGNWNEMYLKTRGEAFGLRIKSFLFQGAYFQFQNYAAFEEACILRRRLVNETNERFRKINLMALPTRHGDSDPFRAETLQDTYTAFDLTLGANTAGLPALHIPGLNRNGDSDFGLQLIGPRMADALVLAVGHTLSTRLQGGSPT